MREPQWDYQYKPIGMGKKKKNSDKRKTGKAEEKLDHSYNAANVK